MSYAKNFHHSSNPTCGRNACADNSSGAAKLSHDHAKQFAIGDYRQVADLYRKKARDRDKELVSAHSQN